ncbi:PhoX family protein [Sneathiella chinensis]|uniref:dTDP-glucose 4,6-dehydratase n=1 Tax=Sneathiella chinensis TaxID=349750 RepID=A0ABQ5U2H5_9PROT|nr:PhoX family phosphatase [Sneathiella chinensis]GLQ06104.1 dTDP-glucose 4,6-dehydratase [Sneathiella chinensis]
MSEQKNFSTTRAYRMEISEDQSSNPNTNDTMGDIINARLGRRDALRGMLAVTAIGGATHLFGSALLAGTADASGAKAAFKFKEISHGVDENHHVAEGYDADILLRWGDPLFTDSPAFDPARQSRSSQERQFGYNNDYVGFIPLAGAADRGLLCVNHEYTNEELMFPGLGRQDNSAYAGMTRAIADVEIAAHGGTVVEIARENGKWKAIVGSKYNRRLTGTTPMEMTGPAAGDALVQTNADPSGRKVLGTLNNCAGGITPWGTYLMAEENFNGYFWNKDAAAAHPHADMLKRYGAPGEWYSWGAYYDRFDIAKDPNELHRFGWIVEVDPMDPTSTPKKRTALGRFKHEGAETIVNKDGRVVVYSGDDERGDYLYKFVTKGKFDKNNRAANMDLLDEGTLYVARFNADGTLDWLPLIAGEGPLTPENGFNNQAEVLVFSRKAGDALGATKMDRPEDVQPNPETNKVYVCLTNNKHRGSKHPVDAANPREKNPFGHIIEITPAADDHADLKGTWEILVQGGNPANPEHKAVFNPATSENGWFGSPDNAAVDGKGRLWISTDQGSAWPKTGTADGIWALETEGALRGTGKMFYRVPVGAEMCGPCFTPDDTALFLAVQHPASDGAKAFPGFERNSTFEDPATRWPDFDPKLPPRPSVVVVTKKGGGIIGS